MARRTLSRPLGGLLAATPTPFDGAGALAVDPLRANLARWLLQPLDGFVLLGSNGEALLLSPEERLEVVRQARACVPPGRLLIAGSGVESTAATVDLSRRMAQAGADAVIVVTPHYYRGRMTAAALQAYFQAVADASPVPVILYSVPANTGVDLPVETVARLASHDNIVGIKDSGGDIVKIARLVQETPDDFCVLAGSAGFFLAALSVGAVGGVMALANLAAEHLARLRSDCLAGRMEPARRTQAQLIPANAAVTSGFGVAGLKAALDLQGFYGGPVRPPLLPLSSDERAALQRTLVACGLLPGTPVT